MAIEKSWQAVAPQLLTSDGNTLGVVNIASTAGFKVKQTVTIANGLPIAPATTPIQVAVQVKRVVSPTQLIVGPLALSLQPPFKQQGNQLLSVRENISMYTVALGAYIYAAEQPKAVLKPDDIEQAVYDQEPTVAIRTVEVDQYGNYYSGTNPLPVSFDGTIAVGDVSIVEGGNTLVVNPDGSINVNTYGGVSNIVELKGPSGNITEVSPAKAANVNLVPVSQIPFSLGSLALPSLINSLLSGLSYDSVTSDSTIGQEILTFYDAGVALTTITMTQTSDGWTLSLGAPILDYLLLENGDYIELENDTGFILLEH